MDKRIEKALRDERIIDITTIGRKSGKARRIEIWFHNVDDEVYISGSPGKRGWYANLLANPKFIFHLKGSVIADLPAQATPITDMEERRNLLPKIDGSGEMEDRIAQSRMVRVSFPQEK
jgi:deazaflavin-dependent oxidoreductase (nitroreductase family)